MSSPKFKKTKLACYSSYFTMSSAFCLPPMLFVTLNEMYGISYTLLGTLILVNFCTQLAVDLIFTAFAKRFNIKLSLCVMPLLTMLGLLIYAVTPMVLGAYPALTYAGLLLGTVIFSVSAGFSEVLLSPIVAAIPSDNPQRDMSLLHSLYAFGVFSVIVVNSIFFALFPRSAWMYLTLFFALLPIVTAVLFTSSPIPNIEGNTAPSTERERQKRGFGIALCVACIFFGSCAENVMSSWASGFIENALHVNKSLGDLLGVAMFAVLLGLARIAYAKFGKNISIVLLVGMIGSVFCYLTAALSVGVVPAFLACVFAGLCSGMLWPGTLIMMEEKMKGLGVAVYALMASGGDFGAAVAPQLMGVVIDKVSATAFASELGIKLGLTAEQVGMKAGMLVSAFFPFVGIFVVLACMLYFKKKKSIMHTKL